MSVHAPNPRDDDDGVGGCFAMMAVALLCIACGVALWWFTR